jgi:molecular chaperone DnaK
MAAQNKQIGIFHLDGIMPARRGEPQIEVTFDIDANGILNVTAKDKATGKEQKIRIEASSGLSDEEIKRMKAEAEANAEADKKAKEQADKLNKADATIFQTEKQLAELGDKIPADKKAPIEAALAKLKEAYEKRDADACEAANNEVMSAFQAASAEMYAAQQQAQQGQAGPQGPQPGADNGSNNNGNPTAEDVDFEEVK